VCRPEDFFSQVILSELKVQCLIAIYRQGSSTLLVHFVLVTDYLVCLIGLAQGVCL
jgi:uncharacterized protein YbgA (DUF1722 family)